jgi:hypothetical protein
MRMSRTLFAASLAVLLGSWSSTAVAQSSAEPQPTQPTDGAVHSRTEWGEQREPVAKDVQDEYRTDSLDTWIRICPTFDIICPDGGTKIGTSMMLGLRLEFDAGDVIQCGFEATGNIPKIQDHNFGGRGLNRNDGPPNPAVGEEISGYIIHPAFYVGYKNPELRAGPLQTIVGVGMGAFMFHDYQDTIRVGRPPTTTAPAAISQTIGTFPKDSEYVFHVSPYLRFEFDISDNFKIGFDLKLHFLLYSSAKKDEVSVVNGMEGSKFSFDHVIWEPGMYFAICF